jgi:hypothetical protein
MWMRLTEAVEMVCRNGFVGDLYNAASLSKVRFPL